MKNLYRYPIHDAASQAEAHGFSILDLPSAPTDIFWIGFGINRHLSHMLLEKSLANRKD